MNSNEVKQAFANAGIKVRVRDLGLKFRICPARDGVEFDQAAASVVASSLGLTDSLTVPGGQFNTPAELVAYKPGALRRI